MTGRAAAEDGGAAARGRKAVDALPLAEAGLAGEDDGAGVRVPTPNAKPELSEETIALLEEAAPKIKTKVVEVTEEMYRSLFEAHPTLRSSFSLEFYSAPNEKSDEACAENSSRVSKGRSLSAQAIILAETIVAVLGSLRHLSALDQNIERIASKHVSRDVLPAHYDALEEFFLGAVQIVITKYGLYSAELMNAFEEAYKFLAFVFTSREAAIRERCIANGGWTGYRKFIITDLEPAKRSVVCRMRPLDGKPVVPFNGGSFISVAVDIPGHGTVTRSFAQSALARAPDDFVVEIKYDQLYNEYPLSNQLLISAISHGMIIDVSCPQGGVSKNFHSSGNSPRESAKVSGCPMMKSSPLAAGNSHASAMSRCPLPAGANSHSRNRTPRSRRSRTETPTFTTQSSKTISPRLDGRERSQYLPTTLSRADDSDGRELARPHEPLQLPESPQSFTKGLSMGVTTLRVMSPKSPLSAPLLVASEFNAVKPGKSMKSSKSAVVVDLHKCKSGKTNA